MTRFHRILDTLGRKLESDADQRLIAEARRNNTAQSIVIAVLGVVLAGAILGWLVL